MRPGLCLTPKGSTMNLNCTRHAPNGDAWDPSCVRCGVPLLDGDCSADQLVDRVKKAFQQKVQATGRQRGTWIEVEELLEKDCWMWWVRPASTNLLGFEAVEHENPDPTGEELSRALLEQLVVAGVDEVEPEPVSRPRRKPSRWERFKRWSRVSGEREFVVIAVPMLAMWSVAVAVTLGWDGVQAIVSLVF